MVICLLSGAAAAQQRPAKGQGLPAEKKSLIVYLSRTNNTKAVADIIHEKVGGKLVALELQTPYPADYQATVQRVVRENETGDLPPLKTVIDGPDQYDFVFVGFPTWDMKLPPPIKSYLHQYSFRGKTIIPFNSNGGYGPGGTLSDRAGTMSTKYSAAGFLHSGRIGKRWTAFHHQRCQGRRSPQGSGELAKNNRDAQVKRFAL